MKRKKKARILSGALALMMAFTLAPSGLTVQAADKAALNVGYPEFKNTESLDDVYDLGKLGVSYSSKDIMMDIYNADIAAGGDSFYMDRILARYGVADGDPNANGNDDGDTFLTRGRALYMYTSDPTVIGFGGTTAYHQQLSGGNMYQITFGNASGALTAEEDTSKRVNYPSNWVGTYKIGGILEADVTKFISQENVAVTAITLRNVSGAEQTVTVNASSPYVSVPGEVEVNGQQLPEVEGYLSSPSDLTEVAVRMTGVGFANTEKSDTIAREVTVPAGESAEIRVVMAFTTVEIPGSTDDYKRFLGYETNQEAIRAQKKEYNLYWAQNLPYIDVPKKAVQKAVDYRWWSERYNSLDANIPGYDYQYPVTIEGVLGYNNAIALTQPMHLQDTKWLRNGYLPYGQLLSVGNSSQSSAFLDNPGNRGNWNNHYGQYIAEAGLEAFNVIGGGQELAENLAYYFAHDAYGQLEHYGNHVEGRDLIAYQSNYMTGNDADTISMNSATGVGQWKVHGENAYVWAAADAAAKLYAELGQEDKAEELRGLADKIQKDVLELLWCEKCQKFETYGVSPTGTLHNPDQPNLVELTESNNYNYFSVGLVPTDADSIAKYKEALKTFSNGEEFPIFPMYTANQLHNKIVSGSNNFSNINFTVQARAYEAALRTYDKEQEYVSDEMLAMMTEWMAWLIYPDSGDVRYPNNSEFYNMDGRTYDNYYRSWIYHNILGNYNYIFIEDMAGIQPRSDEKIELSPIDFSYDHFMINNARYHGHDISVVWDKPDDGKTYYELPEGYSLYVDGELAFTLKELGHVIYDSATGQLEFPDGDVAVATDGSAHAIPTALDTEITDPQVLEMFEKSGIHGMPNQAAGAQVEASYTPEGAREASWAEKHRADGEDPTSKAVNETAPDPQAVVDGTTVNMPFWGNDGSTNETDTLTLKLDGSKDVDMAALYFYNDRQRGGYAEPEKFVVEYWDGSQWQKVTTESREPGAVSANYNAVYFDKVNTDQMRFTFTNQDGKYTAVTEIQLFSEGGERTAPVNAAPEVRLSEKNPQSSNLRTTVEAVASDDGQPYGVGLSYLWEVVEKPSDDAETILASATKASTTFNASEEGEYTLKCTVSDGELSTEETIRVTLVKKAISGRGDDVAPDAVAGSDYTASWEKLSGINDPGFEPAQSSQGNGQGWGNWPQTEGSEHYVDYTWDAPVTVGSCDIFWYDDGGGTRVPSAYRMQYLDGNGEWQDVNILTPYDNTTALNQYNQIDFERVTTTQLRLYMTTRAQASGIYRFKVYEAVDMDMEIGDVYMAVKTGEMPVLPSKVDAVNAAGQLVEAAVVWDTIEPEQFEKDGTVTVKGINSATGQIVTATITVRSDMDQAGITDVHEYPYELTTEAGVVPALPETADVSYNNGTRDNQNVKVVWPENLEELLNKPGDVTLEGTVEGTTAKAKLIVHVKAPDKTALGQAIETAEKLQAGDYTSDSYAKVADALKTARQVYDDADAGKTQISDAVKALNDAVSGLVELKAELQAAIKDAEAVNGAYYTDDTYAALTAALETARGVNEDPAASETAVNEAAAALRKAIGELVRKSETQPILDLQFEKPSDMAYVDDSSANDFDVSDAAGIQEEDYVEGVRGTALQFNGAASYDIPAGEALAPENLTVSYWIKRTGNIDALYILWAKADSSWNTNGYYINAVNADGRALNVATDGGDQAFYVAGDINDFLPENEWTHIAITWDAATKTGKIYKNGEEQAIETTGLESITGDGNAVNRMGENGYPGQFMSNVAMDEFKIYDVALSAEEIAALFKEFSGGTSPVKGDKTALQQLFDESQNIPQDMYTEDSVKVLQAAIAAAEEVLYNNDDAAQEEIDAVLDELQAAIDGLEKRPAAVDKTALEAALQEAASKKSEDYTGASWADFATELQRANDVYKDPQATQERVNAAKEALLAAMKALVEAGEPAVDTSALKSLAEKAASLKKTDYTEESWSALVTALSAVQKVLENPQATQADVDAARTALAAAIEGLAKASSGQQGGTVSPPAPVKPQPSGSGSGAASSSGGSGQKAVPVKTGDEAHTVLWIFTLMLSLAALSGTVLFCKRKRR